MPGRVNNSARPQSSAVLQFATSAKEADTYDRPGIRIRRCFRSRLIAVIEIGERGLTTDGTGVGGNGDD